MARERKKGGRKKHRKKERQRERGGERQTVGEKSRKEREEEKVGMKDIPISLIQI